MKIAPYGSINCIMTNEDSVTFRFSKRREKTSLTNELIKSTGGIHAEFNIHVTMCNMLSTVSKRNI